MSETKYPKYRWFVLIMMFVATLAQGMTLISPSPLVLDISKHMGINLGAATGGAMMPFTLFVALGGIVGGMVIDKFGIARSYIVGLILMAVGSVLMPVIGGSMPGLIILRAIQGAGAGPIIASVSRIAAEWFPAKERALVTGIQGMALSLGIAVGFGAAPAIAANAGWQVALAAMAVVSVIALVLAIVYTFGPKSPVVITDTAADAVAGAAEFKKVLKMPVFWAGFLSAFALSWVMQGYNDLTPGHLGADAPVGLGMGQVAAGQWMGIYQILFMIGSIVSGFVVNKIFSGKAKTAVTVSFILTAIFCVSVLFPFVNKTALLLPFLLLAGFFMGMPTPITMAFVSNSYPEHITGRVGGMTMGLSIFGGTIGVAVGSAALGITGLYDVSIIVVFVVALIGAVAGFGLNAPAIFKKSA